MNDFPRRNRLDLNTPAEKAIYDAIQEVEKVGADTRLTGAVIKLSEARNLVADFVDEIPAPGFIERIIDEKNEVDARSAKLEVFMMKDDFRKIEEVQQVLLKMQLKTMQTYSQCLQERLVWLQK